ncbi:RNA polymerase sigma factor [Terripilifer ovatus]|uniref:RNA polymerase sigma factor n=1 Tax=Terripilifer ovatus TaxID=3032367 RepID=UPI003AB93FAA
MSREDQARQFAETAARQSYGKLVALLAARTGDIARAEDALSLAFAAALAEWPKSGPPATPDAWLLAVARRKLIDETRSRQVRNLASDHLRLLAQEMEDAMEDVPDADIPDRRLALMFACAHPAIEARIRAPLILQTILGFDAAAIASAFLISPATMGQRLVRAKTKIATAKIPFRLPDTPELADRLDAVLEAIYSAFALGWADASGGDARLGNMAGEGIWLGELVAALMPTEPEALGLLALMLHAQARRPARRNESGDYVPLAAQDPALWDVTLIDRAEALLYRAGAMGRPGRYQLEAAVQSVHAARRISGETDWQAIEHLYDALWIVTASPVVALNRAVAQTQTRSVTQALAALDDLAHDPRMAAYQPYWAARADLCARSGDIAAADAAYQRAIGLESDPAVRRFLQKQQARLLRN